MYRGYMTGPWGGEPIGLVFEEVGISLLLSVVLCPEYSQAWIDVCDVVIRRPGVDVRADAECEYASSKGILVLSVGDRSMEMMAKIAKAKLEERA